MLLEKNFTELQRDFERGLITPQDYLENLFPILRDNLNQTCESYKIQEIFEGYLKAKEVLGEIMEQRITQLVKENKKLNLKTYETIFK